MHQDIAARNLLIDEKENLRIFDFDFSIMLHEHYTPERDDMKGVIFTLYEIITLISSRMLKLYYGLSGQNTRT
ncbi:hypothetical protein NHJ13051_000221 [Beauveria bassiana]